MHVVCAHYNLQPYHAARYAAFARLDSEYRLTSLLLRPTAEYALVRQSNSAVIGFELHALQLGGMVNLAAKRAALAAAFDRLRPDAVLCGYSEIEWLLCIEQCIARGIPLVLGTESQRQDATRKRIHEFIKLQVINCFGAALAGGSPHRDYLLELSFDSSRIFLGYDAVDNGYFEENAEKLKSETLREEVRQKHGMPENYFLASARFIEKKNLPRLLQAYASYRQRAASSEQRAGIWDLVLLGDGPLRPALVSQLDALGLQAQVHMPGFKQYPDLPAYYGLASAFIHASTTEQWGLVVNEAMSSGLPVLVSNRCGCAPDLVQNGVNGFTFDPYNVEELAQLMLKISAFNFPLSAFGDASKRIVSAWGPERFASGLKAAVDKALEVGPIKPTLVQRVILKALLAR